jgi:hypothetical protein
MVKIRCSKYRKTRTGLSSVVDSFLFKTSKFKLVDLLASDGVRSHINSKRVGRPKKSAGFESLILLPLTVRINFVRFICNS